MSNEVFAVSINILINKINYLQNDIIVLRHELEYAYKKLREYEKEKYAGLTSIFDRSDYALETTAFEKLTLHLVYKIPEFIDFVSKFENYNKEDVIRRVEAHFSEVVNHANSLAVRRFTDYFMTWFDKCSHIINWDHPDETPNAKRS